MRISDWSSDVCSSDLSGQNHVVVHSADQSLRPANFVHCICSAHLSRVSHHPNCNGKFTGERFQHFAHFVIRHVGGFTSGVRIAKARSEEHTSELQSLMRISYAVFCWKKYH